LIAALAALALPAAALSQPIVSAIANPVAQGAETDADYAKMRAAGVQVIRVTVNWPDVAPEALPAQFSADDPADPAYRWGALDGKLTSLARAGFEPIVCVVGAPIWAVSGLSKAGDGPQEPDPQQLAAFARAAAIRYSGTTPDLPRVRYWQVYNEPNLSGYLMPQYRAGRPYSPGWYRSMVNAFADAVHQVSRDNLVVAGGQSPFTFRNEYGLQSVPPLRFMRDLLCMSKGKRPKPSCSAKVSFDVWAHHPYTSGGPTHSAERPDDVSLGDLQEMKALLDAAVHAGHVVSRRPPLFWVTEFSWDSKPPDTEAVPVRLEARWVAEAVYRMWASGVSLVTWFSLRDQPFPKGYYQSGLYFVGGKPKPARDAFRFPVVAFVEGDGIHVWGRTPFGKRGRVALQQTTGDGWRPLATLSTDRYGVFEGVVRARSTSGYVRARFGGRPSVPFSLRVPPDIRLNPFGKLG
jgi:hypothetical protein